MNDITKPTGFRKTRRAKEFPEALTGQADTAKQILKSRVTPQRIVDGVHLERSHRIGMLRVGPFEPDESLVFVIHSDVGLNEHCRIDGMLPIQCF